MPNLIERAVRSFFFPVRDGVTLCSYCQHPYTSHIKLRLRQWLIIDVPCHECSECESFGTIDDNVHGG